MHIHSYVAIIKGPITPYYVISIWGAISTQTQNSTCTLCHFAFGWFHGRTWTRLSSVGWCWIGAGSLALFYASPASFGARPVFAPLTPITIYWRETKNKIITSWLFLGWILFLVLVSYVPGHALRLHSSVSFDGPGQVLPPLDAGGLEQALFLVTWPSPQVFEQEP